MKQHEAEPETCEQRHDRGDQQLPVHAVAPDYEGDGQALQSRLPLSLKPLILLQAGAR